MSKSIWRILCLVVVGLTFFSACAPAPAATTAPQATEPPAQATEAPKVETPTELNIGAVFGATIDEAWYKAYVQSFERIQAQSPHGLKINLDYTENVWGDDAERALREYAETGKYQILWATSSYSDQVKNLKDKYPEILWAFTGSGNTGLGGNAYWTYNHVHEAAYLLGILAGHNTKTNVIGAVAGFPYDDVNDVLNAYIDGAKSVNPEIKAKITFIESWYDPPKAKEATYALIAAGADHIYAERQGPFEAAAEKGVFGFGQYEDQNSLAPEVVISSTLLRWDPQFLYLIDEWWKHVTEGTPYNASLEPVWFTMAEGATDIAPLHGFEQSLPPEVIEKVMQARQQILDGTLKIELKVDPPVSD